jgi:SnoaL-like domain
VESSFDLEKEVRDLAARRDIYRAVCRYARGQDRMLPEIQRTAFHPEAYIDCGLFAGDGDAWTEFAQNIFATMKGTQHLLGQVDIEVHGDVAEGEVYFIAWHRIIEAENDRDWFFAGRYIDHYEKRDGEWRIAKRRELVDWVRNDPPSDAFIRENPGLYCAGRGQDDFSTVRNWPSSI